MSFQSNLFNSKQQITIPPHLLPQFKKRKKDKKKKRFDWALISLLRPSDPALLSNSNQIERNSSRINLNQQPL